MIQACRWGITKITVTISVALAMSGCVSFGSNLDAKDLTSRPAEIRGIGDLRQRTGQARMLVIHGMGGDRCPGYSVSSHRFSEQKKESPGMFSRMSKELGVCLLNDPRDEEEVHCAEENVDSYPTWKLSTFDYARVVNGQPCIGPTAMRTYEMYYTGAGEKAEEAINRYNKASLGSSVYVNRIIKNDLMVSGFGDAVMYLGEYGEIIREHVRSTLCRMATDPLSGGPLADANCSSEDQPVEFVDSDIYILSHSLGSNIILDTLNEIFSDPLDFAEETEVANRFIDNLKSAYLMANQDALLGMLSVIPGSRDKTTKITTRLAEQTQLVAFSGRNDALSYALAEDACPASSTQCINAALNIVRWGIPLLFADPVKAHTGYFDDKAVLKCVASGCE